MKRLITIMLFCLFVVFAYGQSATVLSQEYTALTLNGVANDTMEFNRIQGEYDVSIQLFPALAGSGDSLDFSHVIYQSNSLGDAVWTALSSADTVSTATDSDGIYAISNFTGVRLRAILTGISIDTVTVTPYTVYKKHKNE